MRYIHHILGPVSQHRLPHLAPSPRGSASQYVHDDPRWAGFRPKLAKWLCLCENYPYRMSFLVLVIMDCVQRALVNRLCLKHPSRSDKYELVHYCKGGEKASTSDATSEAEETGLELDENMPSVEAYFQHVERYIYSHPKARKMLSLDGDPVRRKSARGVRVSVKAM